MSKILYRPNQGFVKNSPISKLLNNLKLNNFQSLHQWSIDNLDDFWSYVWDESQIIGIKSDEILQKSSDFKDTKFFPGAQLNVAENLLTNKLEDQVAVIALSENGQRTEITWQKLREEVAKCAYAMIDLGIRPSDRVVAWTPNVPQTLIFALAALSIGAVVSTASTDFAADAVLDRFSQIEPKLLLACNSYQYNGKQIDCKDALEKIVSGLPTLEKVLITDTQFVQYQCLSDWISPYPGNNLGFVKFAFDHPGFILFSSGTTGKPKCIIHSAAGVLLKLRAEQIFNFDLSSQNKMFFYTTTGWMMWNWLVYVLGSGATIVLYDGSPTYPTVDKLLEIADSESCTHLGVSAKYIDLLSKSKIKNEGRYNLINLKSIISTGSALAKESFEYIYSSIKKDQHLASISGGTDICGCFVSAIPTQPVIAGEIQGACLGMAVDVFDEAGNTLAAGQKGELVCTKPFPSMPLGFWNDQDKRKYHSSYFEKFPNVWTHGDFAAKSESSGFLIYGRSDATLNSNGVRIGTAEIYQVVDEIDEISESLAVSKEVNFESKTILFVVLKPQLELTDQLREKIRQELRSKASPRHVPDLVIQAPELPRTKSNKLVELAVADLINGRPVRNQDGLANPQALDWFRTLEIKFGIK
ncbi:MAG: acetoacetate--CoA ligase [Candidatus Nanopelagicus sp.]